jgi:hypothetical protein
MSILTTFKRCILGEKEQAERGSAHSRIGKTSKKSVIQFVGYRLAQKNSQPPQNCRKLSESEKIKPCNYWRLIVSPIGTHFVIDAKKAVGGTKGPMGPVSFSAFRRYA